MPEFSNQPVLDSTLFVAMPRLPSIIRYFDEFSDRYFAIHDPEIKDLWILMVRGTNFNLSFNDIPQDLKPIIKSWTCFLIQNYSSGTAHVLFNGISKSKIVHFKAILLSTPTSIKNIWEKLMAIDEYDHQLKGLKSILYFLCRFNLGSWTSDFFDFLKELPLPDVDKYAAVRTGDVFLSVEEESILVAHFDSTSQLLKSKQFSVSYTDLRDTAILICAYQFGMRPMQIGMLRMQDVRIWQEVDTENPPVHLTFKKIKQKSSSKAYPLIRAVKNEWSKIFTMLFERNSSQGFSGKDSIFETNSSQAVTQRIAIITERLLPEKRSATDLRHSAAQRLVDAGISHEELAEFMGHSDTDTALVYYDTSKNQAERVNSALGISPIYCSIAKIAHDRFISESDLEKLKGDQQIGAVPHGFEITGIGGCSSGQSACQFNPVTSCYGCRKFMPLNDVKIHHQVLADMRSVVVLFDQASRSDQSSPAYLQLKRTISNIQSIISEITEVNNERPF